MKKKTVFLWAALVCAVGLIGCSNAAPEKDFEFELDENNFIVITKYTGVAQKVVIPAKLDGKPVHGIGEEAFAENTNITSVVIPKGVTSIGLATFAGCTSLTSLTIPNTAIRITGDGSGYVGNDAFYGTSLNTQSKNALRKAGYKGNF
jgi:hypothetical protein